MLGHEGKRRASGLERIGLDRALGMPPDVLTPAG